jgi:hypothetical protein
MKIIEILLQGEHIPDIQILRIDHGAGIAALLAEAARARTCEPDGELLVFLEDEDEPLSHDGALPHHHHDGGPLRLHVHRCRRIAVSVSFNGQTTTHEFGPGKTVAAVKKWAAIKAFGMDPGDAAEHVLQLTGTADRPDADTHIGALASCPDCRLAFDLVPLKRVEG